MTEACTDAHQGNGTGLSPGVFLHALGRAQDLPVSVLVYTNHHKNRYILDLAAPAAPEELSFGTWSMTSPAVVVKLLS